MSMQFHSRCPGTACTVHVARNLSNAPFPVLYKRSFGSAEASRGSRRFSALSETESLSRKEREKKEKTETVSVKRSECYVDTWRGSPSIEIEPRNHER